MKISKKWKYALIGLGVAAIVTIPAVSVVSCAEIVKNSATNSYIALSTVNAYSVNDNGTGSSSEDQVINDVAMGDLFGDTKGMRNAISQSKYSNLSSVTSWDYTESGQLQGLSSTSGDTTIGYKKGLSDNNGINANLSAPDWLQQNNSLIVQQLFTSVLNFLVGPITLYNYLGQQILEWSGTSAGTLRMLTGLASYGSEYPLLTNPNNPDQSSKQNDALKQALNSIGLSSASQYKNPFDLFTDMQGYAPKNDTPVDIGSFANDLVHPWQSQDGQSTFYLYPTDIFYHVQKATLGQTSTNLWVDQSGNSKYSSLLAAYMPATPNTKQYETADNGKSVDYGDVYTTNKDGKKELSSSNWISVAKVSDIKIVFEFYGSSASNSNYQSNQPINCTITKNIDGLADLTNPLINGNALSYNPFYERYFVLNLNPIYVSLQNVGLGKSTSTATQADKSGTGAVDLTNYAALNYYDSQNLLAYYSSEKTSFSNVVYNCINKDGTKLISTHPSFQDANNDYINYYNTAAGAWCFSNNQISNLYDMQQQVNSQALFFEQLASIDVNSSSSSQQAVTVDQNIEILKYINGNVAHS